MCAATATVSEKEGKGEKALTFHLDAKLPQ